MQHSRSPMAAQDLRGDHSIYQLCRVPDIYFDSVQGEQVSLVSPHGLALPGT
jgi:hypothetical protein